MTPRSRILLLLSNPRDRSILRDWLALHYEVLEGSLDQDFDLCIADAPTLKGIREGIAERKKKEAGVFLPFLLLTARQDVQTITRQLGEGLDEVLFVPIEKDELRIRVEILLRTRNMSLELERNRREVFHAIVEQSLVGIYRIERGRFVYLNEAAAKLFGSSARELIGRDPLEWICPADRERVVKAHRSALSKPVQYSFCVILEDGRTIDCEAFERKIHQNGKPSILGGLIDVSELKRIQKAEARLQEEKIEVLMRSERLKGEFLSVISHELRTPLNAIMGFGSFLEDEIGGSLNEKQHEYVEKLLKGSHRMLGLVDDLLDFASIQAGRFGVYPEETDYPSLVEEAVASLEPVARKKGIRIDREIRVEAPVCVDPRRMGQAISKLVSNAVKFTPEGGRVRLKAFLEGDRLITEVEDDGLGIAPEDIPSLFDPFKQVDMGLTRVAGGAGLSLGIVKAIVEAHGGTITVESPGPGKGSTFRFEIPLGECEG